MSCVGWVVAWVEGGMWVVCGWCIVMGEKEEVYSCSMCGWSKWSRAGGVNDGVRLIWRRVDASRVRLWWLTIQFVAKKFKNLCSCTK